MAENLAPETYGLISRMVPYRALECKVEPIAAFAKSPMEVTLRAATGAEATFLYHWRIDADAMGFPHYAAHPLALIGPADMLMAVYRRGVEDGRAAMDEEIRERAL